MTTKPPTFHYYDQLYEKACAIQEGRRLGLWVPILWHLALRRHPHAMMALANWFSDNHTWSSMGAATNAFSALGLYRRAYRAGEANAAQNMAMEHFNRNDLAGYRYWLRRAARIGDTNAATELRCFETRLSHSSARKIGRIRPERRSEKIGWQPKSTPSLAPPA